MAETYQKGEYIRYACNGVCLVDDVRLAVNGRRPVEFFGRTGGVIPTPAEVLSEIKKMAGGDR